MTEKTYELASCLDIQHGGDHYKDRGIQPIEYSQANNLDWKQFNVVKYVTRHKDKKGAEDLKKAIHYLQMALEFDYGIRSKMEYDEGKEYNRELITVCLDQGILQTVDPKPVDELWYPDDSGEWVEYDGTPFTRSGWMATIEIITLYERENKEWSSYPRRADAFHWDLNEQNTDRIVAYKIVG